MEESFGAVLRQYREARGLSMYALARICGINAGNLSRIEQNEFRPRPENLQRLAEALDAPYDDLLAAAGYPVQPLPRLRPYLRSAYGMTEQDAVEIERYIAEHYGNEPGPMNGEDELAA